jgi:hypothetical protein
MSESMDGRTQLTAAQIIELRRLYDLMSDMAADVSNLLGSPGYTRTESAFVQLSSINVRMGEILDRVQTILD